jgi:galactokinase
MYQDSAENQERTRRLVEEFHRRYPEDDPTVVRAPGRVNLIGEHTDYNEGYVLPIAIERDIRFAVRARRDRIVTLYSLNFDQESRIDLDAVTPDPQTPWSNYIRGMAVELTGAGYLLHGMDGVIEGNIPIASGLSSSAAMEIAAGLSFCAVSKQEVEPPELALLAQQAENNFLGVRVGIMDQFVSRMGHPGRAVFLDCRSLAYELIPVPAEEYLFVVADSRQSRKLAGSAYNERRAQCEAAVQALRSRLSHVCSLRDVCPDDLIRHGDVLEDVLLRRARHVVTENQRVLDAVAALRANDLVRFGVLMNESHDSLRDDYEVSSAALDALVAAARGQDGCLGSRLTGAGFGGCTVSLVHRDAVDAFRTEVGRAYTAACGAEAQFYLTRPAAGAGLVRLDSPPA